MPPKGIPYWLQLNLIEKYFSLTIVSSQAKHFLSLLGSFSILFIPILLSDWLILRIRLSETMNLKSIRTLWLPWESKIQLQFRSYSEPNWLSINTLIIMRLFFVSLLVFATFKLVCLVFSSWTGTYLEKNRPKTQTHYYCIDFCEG